MGDIAWTETRVKLADLKPWEHNPRQSTRRQARRLLDSWDKFGQVQTVAIGPDNEVYDGHQRLSALKVVHGNGYEIDARRASRPLTDDERRELTVTLHAGAVGSWDWDVLSGWHAPELIDWGFDDSALTDWKRDVGALTNLLGSEETGETETDALPHYAGDNKYGVPDLLIDQQLTIDDDADLVKWGTQPGGRDQGVEGVLHFYTDDYKFAAVWNNPRQVVEAKPAGIFEVNYSTYRKDESLLYVLLGIYQKRWLSRYWQEAGLDIAVDVCVVPEYYKYALLGVPEGWRSYCTRAYSTRLSEVRDEYEMARDHAGTDDIGFYVYGGGKDAENLCNDIGVSWFGKWRYSAAG